MKTWLKPLRDKYTRLKKRKSVDGLPEYTAREIWVLDKFSFFNQRVIHKSQSIKSESILFES